MRDEPMTLAARFVSSSRGAIARSFSMNVGIGAVGAGIGTGSGSGTGSEALRKEELFVLERVTRGIYAVCALGSWVEVDDLLNAAGCGGASGNSLAKQARRSLSMSMPISIPTSTATSSRKPSPTSTAAPSQAIKTRDDILAESKELRDGSAPSSAGETPHDTQSQLHPTQATCLPSTDPLPSSIATPADAQSSITMNMDTCATQITTQDAESTAPSATAANTEEGSGTIHEQQTQSSPKEMLENVRIQYLETLYTSKSSVAYFAKGPLSRTRALFSHKESGRNLSDLAAFYRDCIIQIKRMDVKYRETLPATIKRIAPYSVEEYDAERAKKAKKKNQKDKGKIGRNGFYPDEEAYVFKWWKDRDLNTSESLVIDHNALDRASKRFISELRFRETQLQILLILEAIAIERTISQDPTQQSSKSQPLDKKGKPKKAQDLNILLDLLIDRLCIWCTVNLGDDIATNVSSSLSASGASNTSSNADTKLHDFALEVVIPFYLSRLPDQCKLIARKLGVSTHATPRRKSSTATKSKAVTPGTSVKRTKLQKPPAGTLQRVLTDEFAASRPRARFSRSTSDLHDLRRAQVDPLGSGTSSRRESFGKAGERMIDNREVDLHAVSQQHQTKIKKMSQLAEQRKQLTAAIDAMQKPERGGGGGSDGNERRKTGGASSSRKSKIPVRNPFGQGVQVMATPKRGVGKMGLVAQSPLARPGGSATSIQSPSVIPSSVNHLQFLKQKRSGISKHLSFLESSVQETPSKRRPDPSANTTEAVEPATPMGAPKEVHFRVPTLPDTNAVNSSFPSTPQPLKRSYSVPDSIQKPPLKRPADTMEQPSQTVSAVNNTMPPSSILSTPRDRRHQPPLPPTAFETPPRFRAERPVVASTPLNPAKPQANTTTTTATTPMSSSIYQSLGWDEGSDDELAM